MIAVVIGCVMWRHRESLGGAVIYKNRMAAYVYKRRRECGDNTKYLYSLIRASLARVKWGVVGG